MIGRVMTLGGGGAHLRLNTCGSRCTVTRTIQDRIASLCRLSLKLCFVLNLWAGAWGGGHNGPIIPPGYPPHTPTQLGLPAQPKLHHTHLGHTVKGPTQQKPTLMLHYIP